MPTDSKALTSFYRRHLPHWQVEGATYFVTYLVKGALPTSIAQLFRNEVEAMARERDAAFDRQEHFVQVYTRAFLRLETYLAAARDADVMRLADKSAQSVILDSLLWFDKRAELRLIAASVMGHHVHIVFDQLTTTLPTVMRRHKNFTALTINRQQGRIGETLWHAESFDHMPRTTATVLEKATYTLLNPVKANLVSEIAAYEGNWWNPELLVVEDNCVSWAPGADLPPGLADL